jgi:TRAP-type C4-dicarboxylate transport system substrate-binding protein
MRTSITRRRFAVGTAAVAAVAGVRRRATAAEPFRLRCSLDTAPSHMRNQSCADYLKKLEAQSDGRIKTELFSAGALFADVNVGKALVQGQAEMACPGTWVMTGFVQDCDVVNLPVLYARPIEVVMKAIDGKTGAHIAEQLRTKLRARVIGPWLSLGTQHWYSAKKPLHTYADLKGMKIRNAGGAALAWRTRFFDAIPNTTAWPDVPLALSQGTFDGLLTTNESAFSAKLWEAGLKFSIQDHQNLNVYVPLVSESFYNGLPTDLQKLMAELWAQNIAGYRANMLAAQERALQELKNHGLETVIPEEAELAALRKRMVAEQDQLVKDLRMTPELTRLLGEDIGSLA